MSKVPSQVTLQQRRKPQSFTSKDLDLLRDSLMIPHESRTLVFEYLAHTHPEHSMKSWHSFYHKKVNALGPEASAINQPPEQFTDQEEQALVDFIASGGSFMVDTTPLLYGQPFLRSEASWAKHYHNDKTRLDQMVSARRGQLPASRDETDGYLDAMLGQASVQLGVDPSVARYLPNHTLSRGPPPPTDQHQIPISQHEDHNHHHNPYAHITTEGDPSAAASLSATALNGSEQQHHHYRPHSHPDPGQPPITGIPVPYEHDYASSSNHPVYHPDAHFDHNAQPTTHHHTHTHTQLDPSLRTHHHQILDQSPHDMHQHQHQHQHHHHDHTPLSEYDQLTTVSNSQHQSQSQSQDQPEQIQQPPTQSAPRPKKRRRAKDGGGAPVDSNDNSTTTTTAAVMTTAMGKTKRRKREGQLQVNVGVGDDGVGLALAASSSSMGHPHQHPHPHQHQHQHHTLSDLDHGELTLAEALHPDLLQNSIIDPSVGAGHGVGVGADGYLVHA